MKPETRMNRDRAIRVNFVTSVWALVGYCLIRLIYYLANASQLNEKFGVFSVRVAAWPLVVGLIELMLWFKPFRYSESGARVMSAFMGLLLLINPVLVSLIVTDLYGQQVSSIRLLFFVWVAVAHLCFAIVQKR